MAVITQCRALKDIIEAKKSVESVDNGVYAKELKFVHEMMQQFQDWMDQVIDLQIEYIEVNDTEQTDDDV